ncbi:hypothetical protein FSP39_010193 [Pinctada imbricata]|uniref:Mutator-like transposase domain-containing protein n=1 Tax=Pinctada imbricata TaxID=66713 RepID=A0AA88YMU1_PINIB|nr:hypothetical protein FSP39_010193 [Pinctada imbricata]
MIVDNAVMRFNAQQNDENRLDAFAKQETVISQQAKQLLQTSSTLIPSEWLRTKSFLVQSHFERISDYLLAGENTWWQMTDKGVEFFDGIEQPKSHPEGPVLQHARSTNLKVQKQHLLEAWRECKLAMVNGKLKLPMLKARDYDERGNMVYLTPPTGHASLVGEKTKKIVNFSSMSKKCRICSAAKGGTPREHNCRLNWQGSAKAMEPAMACQMLQEVAKEGGNAKTLVMDNDSTTIAHMKSSVDPSIKKELIGIIREKALLGTYLIGQSYKSDIGLEEELDLENIDMQPLKVSPESSCLVDTKNLTFYVSVAIPGRTSDIVQIAADTEDRSLNIYKKPSKPITPEATEATGLRYQHGEVTLNGEDVPSTNPKEGLHQFLRFLEKCPTKPFIIGHNIQTFDMPILMYHLKHFA